VTARISWRFLVLVSLAVLLLASPAAGQLMHLDPIPFFTQADSTSRLALVVDADRFWDEKFGWTANRLLLTAVLPAGDRSAWFLRLPHVSFDTGSVPLSARWPWVLGVDGQDGWPHDQRVTSLGKIEVGVTGPVVPGVDYGVALGLPTGSDRLYPMSSLSIPLRVQGRGRVGIGRGLQGGVLLGYLLHMDSGRHELASPAFPGGYQFGVLLDAHGSHRRRGQLTWDLRQDGGRQSQLVGISGWFPWTDAGSVGLKVAHEIRGSLDRPSAWYVTLSWRFDSPKYAPGTTVPAAGHR